MVNKKLQRTVTDTSLAKAPKERLTGTVHRNQVTNESDIFDKSMVSDINTLAAESALGFAMKPKKPFVVSHNFEESVSTNVVSKEYNK